MFEEITIKNLGRLKEIRLENLNETVLIFGKNGSGKTTFSRIFHYISTGRYKSIFPEIRFDKNKTCYFLCKNEDKNIRIIISSASGELNINPQDLPEKIVVFNKDFIDDNVYIGKEIRQENQESLYEFIVGKEQITLKDEIKQLVDEEEKLKNKLEALEKTLTQNGINLKKLDLPNKNSDEINKELEKLEKDLDNLSYIDEIKKLPKLQKTNLHSKIEEILTKTKDILNTSLKDLNKKAEELKRKHFEEFENLDKKWFSKGINLIKANQYEKCPLCKASLNKNEFVKTLIEGISEEYEKFIKDIQNLKREISNIGLSNLWEIDKKNRDNYSKWNNFVKELSKIYELRPADINQDIEEIKDNLFKTLETKLDNLNESINILGIEKIEEFLSIIKEYNSSIQNINNEIEKFLEHIQSLKEKKEELEEKRKKLKYALLLLENKDLIEKYKITKKNLSQKQNERKSKQNELEEKIRDIMNEHCKAINKCLEEFGADFELKQMEPAKTKGKGKKGKQKVNYGIKLKNVNQDIDFNIFNYSLSEGDKTTLAFAFFISKFLSKDNIEEYIVIIDDPISSLDYHRIEQTTEYIVNQIIGNVKQCYLLTHNELFFEKLYEKLRKIGLENNVSYLEFRKGRKYSTIEDIDPIKKIEENKNYLVSLRILREYYYDNNTDYSLDQIRGSIRIALEFYLKKKYYPDFEHLDSLGKTLVEAKQKAQRSQELKERYRFILDNYQELEKIKNFSSPSHHAGDLNLDDNEINLYVEKTIKIIEK